MKEKQDAIATPEGEEACLFKKLLKLLPVNEAARFGSSQVDVLLNSKSEDQAGQVFPLRWLKLVNGKGREISKRKLIV